MKRLIALTTLVLAALALAGCESPTGVTCRVTGADTSYVVITPPDSARVVTTFRWCE